MVGAFQRSAFQASAFQVRDDLSLEGPSPEFRRLIGRAYRGVVREHGQRGLIIGRAQFPVRRAA